MTNKNLHIGIDATNIRQGGGVTHLTQLIHSFKPNSHDIQRITIWGARRLEILFPKEEWLIFETNILINLKFTKFFWQLFILPFSLKSKNCDILYSPGGITPFFLNIPSITMSQNMLPFEKKERLLFGKYSFMNFKFIILKILQLRSFNRSNGIIFLSDFALNSIKPLLNRKIKFCIIPHGIEKRFINVPKKQNNIEFYNISKPYKLLYVSILMPYKHQIEIAKAIYLLRNKGFPLEITFIGSSWGSYGKRFLNYIKQIDFNEDFIKWEGGIKFENIDKLYKCVDAFIFGSSCENLPNILIEAMASGIPIACSNKMPMTDILGDFGFYFDPKDPISIANAIQIMVENHEKRYINAINAFSIAQKYNWESCANSTFSFIKTF